jgi:hypothetical protein
MKKTLKVLFVALAVVPVLVLMSGCFGSSGAIPSGTYTVTHISVNGNEFAISSVNASGPNTALSTWIDGLNITDWGTHWCSSEFAFVPYTKQALMDRIVDAIHGYNDFFQDYNMPTPYRVEGNKIGFLGGPLTTFTLVSSEGAIRIGDAQNYFTLGYYNNGKISVDTRGSSRVIIKYVFTR